MQISEQIRPVARRILLSRFLTRSGDQAWDFAVPLVLVLLLPNGIQAAALYFLAIRFGQVLLAPRVGELVDRLPRLKATAIGIGMQVVFMFCGLWLILRFSQSASKDLFQPELIAQFGLLAVCGLISNLGALVAEIAVANDIVPTAIPATDLATVNSRLKQIDLATEVGSPIVAGLLLTVRPEWFPMLGFTLVAVWNMLSFWPEYQLIRSVVKMRPDLQSKLIIVSQASKVTLLQKLTGGWREFFKQPVMPAMLAFSLLWLSVLSPHGILLAAFLKDGWAVSEPMIGLFRGGGAVFGLAATVLFPYFERRHGVLITSRGFIVFQAAMVGLAIVSFHASGDSRLFFLGFVLLSRVGLYGFSVGETQIRQLGIPEVERGRVNGFASALTSIATLGLYGAGSLFSQPSQFAMLVYASGGAVFLAAFVFTGWSLFSAPRKKIG